MRLRLRLEWILKVVSVDLGGIVGSLMLKCLGAVMTYVSVRRCVRQVRAAVARL